MADVVSLALAQQRRLAPSGKCNSVFDTYSAAVCLIEHGATGLVANGKNELLPFFSVGARLEDHVDRYAHWRYQLG